MLSAIFNLFFQAHGLQFSRATNFVQRPSWKIVVNVAFCRVIFDFCINISTYKYIRTYPTNISTVTHKQEHTYICMYVWMFVCTQISDCIFFSIFFLRELHWVQMYICMCRYLFWFYFFCVPIFFLLRWITTTTKTAGVTKRKTKTNYNFSLTHLAGWLNVGVAVCLFDRASV